MATPLFVSERSRPQVTTQSLSVGCLIFPQMDQIDFTGPFEVLSRMSDTTVHVVGKELAPVRDMQGLRLTPDLSIAEAGTFDVLLVPGGYLHIDLDVSGPHRPNAESRSLQPLRPEPTSCYPLPRRPGAGYRRSIHVSQLPGTCSPAPQNGLASIQIP